LSFVAVRTLAAAHPSLERRFPGNPVLPRMVLLEQAIDGRAVSSGTVSLHPKQPSG